MREHWKKTAILAAVGFVLGIFVGLGFLLPYGIGQFYREEGMSGLLRHMTFSGLLGMINMGSTFVYDLEHWSILRCTLTHFAITMTCMCAIGFSQGWFSLGDPVTWWILGISVIVYFIIWLIIYTRYKREVRRINEALRRWKDGQRDE